jgi:hypothetical protein
MTWQRISESSKIFTSGSYLCFSPAFSRIIISVFVLAVLCLIHTNKKMEFPGVSVKWDIYLHLPSIA